VPHDSHTDEKYQVFTAKYASRVKNYVSHGSGVLAWSVRVEFGVVLWSVEWTFWSDIVGVDVVE
jgi:hypothetical protein